MAAKPEDRLEQAPEEGTLAHFQAPQNAITEDGQWLVMICIKIWTSREGRRGVMDPSGGMTFAPVYGTEIRVSFPLVDAPTVSPPEGTLSLEQYQRLVMMPLATATRKAFVPDQKDDEEF